MKKLFLSASGIFHYVDLSYSYCQISPYLESVRSKTQQSVFNCYYVTFGWLVLIQQVNIY